MTTRTLLILAISLVLLGCASAHAISLVLLGWASARADERPEIVQILVARQDIPRGTALRKPEDWFKRVRYVRGDEPKNAFRDFAELKGRVVLRDLAEDQPVKRRDVSLVGVNPPTGLFPPGMRACTFPIPLATAATVLPGLRIDVLSVKGENGQAQTEVAVSDVEVLAVHLTRDPKENMVTVTVLATPKQAEILAAAQNRGLLRVVLRAPEEDKNKK